MEIGIAPGHGINVSPAHRQQISSSGPFAFGFGHVAAHYPVGSVIDPLRGNTQPYQEQQLKQDEYPINIGNFRIGAPYPQSSPSPPPYFHADQQSRPQPHVPPIPFNRTAHLHLQNLRVDEDEEEINMRLMMNHNSHVISAIKDTGYSVLKPLPPRRIGDEPVEELNLTEDLYEDNATSFFVQKPFTVLKPLSPRRHANGSGGSETSVSSAHDDQFEEVKGGSGGSGAGSSSSAFVLGKGNADEISPDILTICEAIGEGSFGKVYKGELCGREVAVKKLKISRKSSSAQRTRAIEKFENEVSILKSLRHPNIVSFLGVCTISTSTVDRKRDTSDVATRQCSEPLPDFEVETETYCMVTELCPNGSLLEYLLKKKKLSWFRYLQLADDVASGLKFLHHKGVIHRDLKPSNLLLTQPNRIKIADFGLAHMKVNPGDASRPYGICGTPCYMAPEVLRNQKYGVEADIFSLGIVLCQMITGTYPFARIPLAGDAKKDDDGGAIATLASYENRIAAGERPEIPSDCLPELKELIEKCWAQDPGDRPVIDDVLSSLSMMKEKLDAAVNGVLDDLLDDMPPESRKLFEEMQARMKETQTELMLEKERSRTEKENTKQLREQSAAKTKALHIAYQQLHQKDNELRSLNRQISRLKDENEELRRRLDDTTLRSSTGCGGGAFDDVDQQSVENLSSGGGGNSSPSNRERSKGRNAKKKNSKKNRNK